MNSFIGWNRKKFSPANLSSFTVVTSSVAIIPYSGKTLRIINFAVLDDFTTASKINSLKSYYSTESYDSLVDPHNLICEMYRGEITSKIFCLKNYLLYAYGTHICTIYVRIAYMQSMLCVNIHCIALMVYLLTNAHKYILMYVD